MWQPEYYCAKLRPFCKWTQFYANCNSCLFRAGFTLWKLSCSFVKFHKKQETTTLFRSSIHDDFVKVPRDDNMKISPSKPDGFHASPWGRGLSLLCDSDLATCGGSSRVSGGGTWAVNKARRRFRAVGRLFTRNFGGVVVVGGGGEGGSGVFAPSSVW